jgi:hypothetical protein
MLTPYTYGVLLSSLQYLSHPIQGVSLTSNTTCFYDFNHNYIKEYIIEIYSALDIFIKKEPSM